MEPFLKSVGGKRWLSAKLAAEIIAAKPELYVEPFVGGGAVALALPISLPKVVADANPALIAAWRLLRYNTPDFIADVLRDVERQYPNTAFGYASARDALNAALANPEADETRLAALTLYINVRCFNGLWRVNGSGGFNVPWANYKKIRRLTLAEIQEYHVALQSTAILHLDFRKVLHTVQQSRCAISKMALYVDSPYDGMFTDYTAEGFDEIDQRDLAHWLKHLAKKGASVWATNSDTPLIRSLYSWANVEALRENHSVGAKGSSRGERGCLLIRGQ